MSPEDGSTTLTLNDRQAEEIKMREALGLTSGRAQPNPPGEQGRPKSGQGSEGPVVVSTRRATDMSDSLRARLASLTEELKAERSERVAAQQALADAQRVIQQLQTKLAHTEMAAAELLAVVPVPSPKPNAEKPVEPKKRGRSFKQPSVVEQAEPEPVQWWLPSYKASKPKRARSTS